VSDQFLEVDEGLHDASGERVVEQIEQGEQDVFGELDRNRVDDRIEQTRKPVHLANQLGVQQGQLPERVHTQFVTAVIGGLRFTPKEEKKLRKMRKKRAKK
jgi:hypothetical protein